MWGLGRCRPRRLLAVSVAERNTHAIDRGMNILMVTPVPTHPATHGNRMRVRTVVDALTARGHRVYGLYLGFADVDAGHMAAMRDMFAELVALTPPWMKGGPASPPAPRRRWWTLGKPVHGIDDWAWDMAGAETARLCADWDIDCVWVHYVWCSHVLTRVPPGIARIIDTHDLFADRHKALAKSGAKLSFFYTSRRAERRGLRRADHVIAIQDAEADILASRYGLPNVHTIGHVAEPAAVALTDSAPETGGKLRVGYIASINAINVAVLQALQRAIQGTAGAVAAAEWVLAGPIADHPAVDGALFTRLGPVDAVADFYSQIDAALNPHMGGTGLKIKSVEALMHDCPLIATDDALIGLGSSRHSAHRCQSPADVVQAVMALTAAPEGHNDGLLTLRRAGQRLIAGYVKAQQKALDGLLDRVQAEISAQHR